MKTPFQEAPLDAAIRICLNRHEILALNPLIAASVQYAVALPFNS